MNSKVIKPGILFICSYVVFFVCRSASGHLTLHQALAQYWCINLKE